MPDLVYYHVTDAANVPDILREGLAPGWGDDGFGVYVFTSLSAALDYAAQGGWDASSDPDAMTILSIEADSSDLSMIIPHPEWPNPEFYASVMIHEMDEDEDSFWRPAISILGGDPSVTDTPCSGDARAAQPEI